MMEKQTQRDRVILVKTGVQRARIGQLFSISSAQIIIFAEIQDRLGNFWLFLSTSKLEAPTKYKNPKKIMNQVDHGAIQRIQQSKGVKHKIEIFEIFILYNERYELRLSS